MNGLKMYNQQFYKLKNTQCPPRTILFSLYINHGVEKDFFFSLVAFISSQLFYYLVFSSKKFWGMFFYKTFLLPLSINQYLSYVIIKY